MPDAQPDVLGRRIAAALIDIVVLVVIFVVIGLLFGKADSGDGNASVNLSGVSALLFFAALFVYYWLPEAQTGQTLGKRLLGLRVRRLDGSPVGYGPAAVRTILRLVDGLPFLYFVGFVTTLVTGSRRARIGDLAASTMVGPA